MNNWHYIEANEIENIASHYQNEGYQVRVSPLELDDAFETKPIGYPLMATKCCRKLAFAVVERTKLTEESQQLDTLRQQAACHTHGYSLVMVAINEQLSGTIELRPTVRPEAKEVVERLQAAGKTVEKPQAANDHIR